MLASILPGLREIRAPLAAGYLWFVTAWLLLEDSIESGKGASGAVDALSRLSETAGPVAVGAAVTFVAYLAGALWEPIAQAFADAAWSLRSRFTFWRYGRSHSGAQPKWLEFHTARVARGEDSRVPPFAIRLSRQAWSRLDEVGLRLFFETDEVVRDRLGVRRSSEDDERNFLEGTRDLWLAFSQATSKAFELPSDPVTAEKVSAEQAAARAPIDDLVFGSERELWWRTEAGGLMGYEDAYEVAHNEGYDTLVIAKERGFTMIHVLKAGYLTTRLFEELPLSARRLVGEEQESFLELSRMEGEVQFRFALAIPLAVATSVVTFGLGVSIWVWLAATFAGVLAGAALLADGWRRDRRRNDLLVELLAIGKAKSPTFERLLERAKQLTPEGREGAPLDEVEASLVSSGG